MDRRSFLAMAGGASAAMVAASCASSNGSDGSSGSGSGTVVRYGHWDNGSAQALYAELFQDFMDDNPDIEVRQEFASFNAFQERMTTQIAGGEVADIFWVAAAQILAYNEAGIYADLEKLPGFDLDALDADIVDRLRIDGKLTTLPNGLIVPCLRWNQTFLDEVGAEVPSAWTWNLLAEWLTDYTKNNPKGRRGIFYHAGHDLTLEAWLRQNGEDLWTEDGQLGASVECISEYLAWWEELRNSGTTLTIEEQGGIGVNWSELGSEVLADISSHNQIIEASSVFPDYVLQQRPTPTIDAPAEGHAFTFFERLGVYSRVPEENLEAVGRLLTFTLTDVGYIEKLGPLQGTPASAARREALENSDDPNVQQVNAVTNEILEMPMRPRFEAPANASTWRRHFDAALEQIVFNDTSITAAVTEFHSTVSAAI